MVLSFINVCRWYEPLKEFTFPTSFIPLSVDDAKVFINFQERLLSELNITNAGSKNIIMKALFYFIFFIAMAGDPNAPFPPYDDPRLIKLEQQLDDIIQV